MYEVGEHRICRCVKTGVIIDSSSHIGAVVKLPGDEWIYNDNTFVWHDDGTGTVKMPDGYKEDFHSVSFEEGLAYCFSRFAANPQVLTLFRFTNKRGKRYKGGYIKWVIDENRPRPRKSPSKTYLMLKDWKRDPSPQRIVWREGRSDYQDIKGTPDTNTQCWLAVEAFVKKWDATTLWGMDHCDFVHRQIWDNLVEHHGFPVLKRGYLPDS
ncbi:hypothetical protein FPRO05_08072 [Fusarium proliferatum]|uniref:Uncharacterized protein n=1 Tax=Gibberella intermedia TaxID=948311 RepID=A0A365NIJ9_GIBIN|nr:hypothetical protein FPRO05_08072 [Fusarium proliferatum]